MLPRRALRRLADAGIFAQASVSLEYQQLAKQYVVRGVESGGAVEALGRYVTFCGDQGEPLSWLHPLDGIGVNGVHALSQRADRFAAILATDDPQARAFEDAVLRTLSSAYRDELPRGIRYRDTVADDLSSTMDRVRIASLPRSFVTLTSHSGTVPITVGNELDTAVRVVVAIHSQHLTVTGGGRATQVIPPHRKVAVDVRATARTAGVFQLDVTLLTPNGQVYDSEQLFVRSTAYGTVAILITGGATGVLLIAVIIRLGRRALRARRAAGAAA